MLVVARIALEAAVDVVAEVGKIGFGIGPVDSDTVLTGREGIDLELEGGHQYTAGVGIDTGWPEADLEADPEEDSWSMVVAGTEVDPEQMILREDSKVFLAEAVDNLDEDVPVGQEDHQPEDTGRSTVDSADS